MGNSNNYVLLSLVAELTSLHFRHNSLCAIFTAANSCNRRLWVFLARTEGIARASALLHPGAPQTTSRGGSASSGPGPSSASYSDQPQLLMSVLFHMPAQALASQSSSAAVLM
jgi:hypothetical protein